uniref:SAP domain-containing protein n=1 Tax=Pyramimonas orientalis virus TaxID=455367 RepID=A0A7M3UNZ5_POV01|nr:hypothetical protein HWQ62_00308 [Pyramimonas orientalis virus]
MSLATDKTIKHLKNHLNISTLFYKNTLNFNNIEFCFLYLTSSSFRKKDMENQEKSIRKLRNSLGTQIQNLLDTTTTSKNKTLLYNYNPAVHELFLNEKHSLYEEFIFVIEKIVKSYKFVIVENESFYINDSTLKSKDKVIIIYKNSNSFYPVFSTKDKYVFDIDDDTLQLIQAFITKKESVKETYNDEQIQEYVDEQPIEEVVSSNVEAQLETFIVNEDDIIFDDFDDNLTIKYNNKSYLQKFSEDEKVIYIQNLFSSSTSKYDKVSGKTFVSMMNKQTNVPNTLLQMDVKKVANVDKIFEDYMEYIDLFIEFKETFPDKPFYSSIYHQYNTSSNPNATTEEDIVRNSFTSSFDNLNNDDIDAEDCMNTLSRPKLEAIMKAHGIEIKGSKEKLCESLVSYNFLETEIVKRITDNLSIPKLLEVVKTSDIEAEDSEIKTHKRIIELLLKNRIVSFLYPFFTKDELVSIALKHNVYVHDDYEELMNSLIYANVLMLYKGEHQNDFCEIDDHVTAIMVSSNNVTKNHNSHLEMFRALPNDNIHINGFYFNGDKSTKKFETFDVEKYLSLLHNISKFLPLKCTLQYFNGTTHTGTITESIQNNSILKIKTSTNEITYYNLQNIHDNKFFLYTELNDSFEYSKSYLNMNIFFYINNLPFDDIIKFVSLTMDEYLHIFQTKLDSLDNINETLKKFGTTFSDLNHADYESLLPYISNEKTTGDDENVKNATASETTKKSVHKFLSFDENNVSDLKKMFLLHSNNYFQIIHDTYASDYATHTVETLGTETSFQTNNDPITEIEHKDSFENFEDLKSYKQNVNEVTDHNVNIELTLKQKETNTYITNVKTHLATYQTLLDDFNAFYYSKHEKEFIQEQSYSKPSKNLDGFHSQEQSLINSDPNNQYTSIDSEATQGDTISEQNELIHYLSTIVGVPLTNSEMTYITRQTSSIFNPILTKMMKGKKPNAFKKKNDISLWNHYTNIVVYSAFLTLMAQHKYKMNEIFKKCKELFSLHGFPLDDDKEKTFTKYMACVVFSLFGSSNAYFQTEQFLDTQIIAIIRLIFQYNPSIKSIFDNMKILKNDKVPPKESAVNNIKPFYNTESITKQIKNGMSTELTKDYKLHTINNADTNTLLIADPPLQIVCPYEAPVHVDIFGELFESSNTKPIILSKNSYVSVDATMDVVDDVSVYISDFADLLSFDFKEFNDIFIIQKDPRVAHFYYIIKFNHFYINLLQKYDTLFMPYYNIITSNKIPFSTNIVQIVLDIFKSVESTLQQMFRTDNIFTFKNTEMDPEKRELFSLFLKQFKSYISELVVSYNNTKIDVVALKSRAEILREEEKQTKLSKYENLEDDQMFIFMELEKLVGISIDTENTNDSRDDAENEELFQVSEDADIPE